MKKTIIITVISIIITTIIASCIGFGLGYNHVIKNQYMEECADYDNMYYIIIDGNRHLYEK